MEEDLSKDPNCRIVILEIGCGTRVPAIRQETEWVLRDCLTKLSIPEESAAESTEAPRVQLIRINPEAEQTQSCHVMHIQSTALDALLAIEQEMQQLSSSKDTSELTS